MKKERAVVEIDRAESGDFSVDDGGLGMKKAGGVFKNPDASAEKNRVKTTAHAEDEFFVGDSREINSDVNATFGGAGQGEHERVAEHEIRGVKIGVFCGLGEEFDIEVVRDGSFRERRVIIRQDIAVLDRSDVTSFRKISFGGPVNASSPEEAQRKDSKN